MSGNSGSSWAIAVPWILAIVGWIVVNHQNNTREHRKETRALLDAFIKFADELERDAVKYHTDTKADDALAYDVKRRLSRLGAMLNTVGGRKLDIEPARRCLTGFRQAITQANFDSAAFKHQNRDSTQVLEIGQNRDRLINSLEQAFTVKFYRGLF